MYYQVKIYKPDGKLWKELKDIHGDAFGTIGIDGQPPRLSGLRVLTFKNGSTFEIPADWPILFSCGKTVEKLRKMEKETGKHMPLDPGLEIPRRDTF